jgi:RNA polymerase sigma-70 factor (ECF subfamily)
MDTTNFSLLERLKLPVDQKAWSRFVDLYTPLIYTWARQVGLQEADAVDLVQEVFALLVQKMPEFTYDRKRSFRAWLHTVTLNKWRDRCRRRAARPSEVSGEFALDAAKAESADSFSEAEYRRHLVTRALELMQAEFQPTTWKACWEFVVVGRSAEEIARQLGISANAVFLAKARVLRRLRQELEGLLDP